MNQNLSNQSKIMTIEELKKFIVTHKVMIISLKKVWFDLMETGEKDFEMRDPSKWIESRLYNPDGSVKHHDYVLAFNGYGYDKPWFICKYEGFGTQYSNHYTFSNGVQLQQKSNQYMLFLGPVLHKGNIKK